MADRSKWILLHLTDGRRVLVNPAAIVSVHEHQPGEELGTVPEDRDDADYIILDDLEASPA
jgi:hypothetical protein